VNVHEIKKALNIIQDQISDEGGYDANPIARKLDKAALWLEKAIEGAKRREL